jgi:serine/threonine protein kinase
VGVFSKLKELFSAGNKKKMPRTDIKKRFDIQGKLGQGSMSKVFRAYDRKIGRVICLKVLDKVKTDRFESRFPGLNRPTEGAICVVLRHKNIVQTYEHGMTREGEQFLVMELIEGMGLNYLIETRHASLNTNRLNYLLQITDGLEYVHQQGYIHRDICPRNIMVTGEGLVKIIDFGLSIPLRPEFCRPGNRTGTNDYLAPEVIRRHATDHRVDLFALGVTAYEVITASVPWEKSQGSLQTLQAHVNVPGRDPRERRPNLDDPTAEFLIKAIEREPGDRFQTCDAFRTGLKGLPKAES